MLKSPYPYFGGKSRVANIVWQALGDVDSFIDPFMGSAALLLGRPAAHLKRPRREIVNDLDGLLVNFWRAVKADPEAVARYADEPVHESTLHAKHYWLVAHKFDLTARLEGDPEWYDAKAAGWWVWGMYYWIGGHFCGDNGSWIVKDGRMQFVENAQTGISRRRPRMLVGTPQVIVEQLPMLAARLRDVKVLTGDWSRCVTQAVCWSIRDTEPDHITGIVLDPPYALDERVDIYTHESGVSHDVYQWVLEHGDNPRLRIALFGFDTEHNMPSSWRRVTWKTPGGMARLGDGRGRANAERETIWFSPHCLKPDAARQLTLFDDAAD